MDPFWVLCQMKPQCERYLYLPSFGMESRTNCGSGSGICRGPNFYLGDLVVLSTLFLMLPPKYSQSPTFTPTDLLQKHKKAMLLVVCP
jgi:hypothetical protein